MIDLPEYVKRQRKANGREYIYYERYRGTPRAWPRVSLPNDLHSPDFWLRYQLCQRLDAKENEGRWEWRYVDEVGRFYELPDPKEGEEFWLRVEKAAETAKAIAAGEGKTFLGLVTEYKDHQAFKKLSDSTRKDYERYIEIILTAWGDERVASLTAVDAQKAIDSYQSTPAAARAFRALLVRLINWGIPRGYSKDNPAEKTEKIDHDSTPYKPWPDWAFELFFEHARKGLHLPVLSAVFTGQRSVDVVTMRRPKSDDQVVELIARKTNAKIWAPIHSEYRLILERNRADHTSLHLREDGEAWTVAGFRTAWQRELTFVGDRTAEDRAKTEAMQRIRAEGLVFHGLRKNAVNMLLEVGCTAAEVGAIVEMSEAMVRHYSKDVNKRRLAVNGMKKLEGQWGDMRGAVFGSSLPRKPNVKNSC